MTDENLESEAPRASAFEQFALVTALMVALAWLPMGFIMRILFAFGFPTGVPTGVHCQHVAMILFTFIAGVAGLLNRTDRLDGVSAWLCAGATCIVTVVSAQFVLVPMGYPDRGLHETVVAAGVCITTAVAASWALKFLVDKKRLLTGTRIAFGIAAIVAFVTAPGIRRPDLNTSLPLAVFTERSGVADIQDYAISNISARPVSVAQAEGYAERNGLALAAIPGNCPTAEGAEEVVADLTWRRDDRVAMSDRTRYPNGKSGCVLTANLCGRQLHVVYNCDWGI